MEVIVAALPGEKSRNNGIKEHKEGGYVSNMCRWIKCSKQNETPDRQLDAIDYACVVKCHAGSMSTIDKSLSLLEH